MTQHTDRTLKLIACIRELASLGLRSPEIARLLNVSRDGVKVLASMHKISTAQSRGDTPLQRAIRDGYAAGVSPKVIAKLNGATVKSVHVIASRMGLSKHRTRHDPARFKRGYEVPDELWDDYKLLRHYGASFREAGIALEILPRKQGERA